MAVLGCISAITTLGAEVTIPDMAISGIVGGGITSIVFSLLNRRKNPIVNNYFSGLKTFAEMHTEIIGSDNSRENTTFLDSLKAAHGQLDGWYKDPVELHQLRYFENGKWTIAISDSDSILVKKASLTALRKNARKAQNQDRPSPAVMPNPQIHQPAIAAQSDLVSQIERLSELHKSGALTDAEFQQAKRLLIERL